MSSHLSDKSGWHPEIEEICLRRDFAEQMGGEQAIQRQHDSGRLTARERIAALVDTGSFREIGAMTGKAKYDADGNLIEVTPSNIIIGTARIDDRPVVISAEDFTVRGGSSESTNPDKWQYVERLALEYRMPIIRLVETAGGSIKLLEQMQATKIPGYPNFPWMEMLGKIPVIGLALGAGAGFGAWRIVATHFSAMVKETSQVFAAGPAVVAPGIGENLTKEELGGYKVHTRGSGVVDNEAKTEADAFAQVRCYLSYLPQNVYNIPSRTECTDPVDRREEELASIVPREKRRVYKMRRILALVFDDDSLFEIGRYQGGSTITMFGRLNGYPVGILANDPYVHGGALTEGSAEKIIRFVDTCDTFHIPVLNFIDQPGTAVGSVAEARGTVRKGVRAAGVIEQATIPWCSVFIRRSFGLAGAAYAPMRGINIRYAWPSAYWGSIPIEGGVEAAYKRDIENAPDPEARREELLNYYRKFESPFRTAERFGIQDIIDPRDTRVLLCEWVESAYQLVKDLPAITQKTMRP